MGQIMRRGDVLCRYGGEEFVVLLPGATKREIATVAERLRIRVEDEPFLRTLGDQSPIAVTISVGGALSTPDQDSTEPCDLLHAADGSALSSQARRPEPKLLRGGRPNAATRRRLKLGGWSQSPHRLRLKGPFVENLVQVFHRDLLDAFNFILDRHPIAVRQPPATDA